MGMSLNIRRRILVGTVIMLLPTASVTREYHVNRGADRSVVFLSDAPLEDFEGVTDEIDGYVLWPGDDSLVDRMSVEGTEFYIEVALDGLDTGIGLRNRHMRENYLHTEKHPVCTFGGSKFSVASVNDSSFAISLNGIFSLHGVKQERSISVQVSRISGGYHVMGEFVVGLEDHKIKVPQLMFFKIDQDIVVSVDFVLTEVEQKE